MLSGTPDPDGINRLTGNVSFERHATRVSTK